MSDEKTVDLRIDASQGAQALNQVEQAAEGAADAMGDLAVAVQKTEENVKKIVTTSRDYQSAARSVGDSVQSVTRFEAAYRASLNDTANSAQIRAQILAASFSRTIGGAADEARAASLLAAGHKEAAAAVRFMLDNHVTLPSVLNNTANASVHAARGFGNMGNIAQQAGYQIADVAAVAAAGGNAMAAAGTQLGQFLGAFGPTGAMVGAAVTVLGLFATNMLKVGDETKKTEGAAKTFEAALSDLVKIEKEYNEALRERQGLPSVPDDTANIDRRVREAEGRIRALNGDDLQGEKKPSFIGQVYDDTKERLGFGRTASEFELAQAEYRAALADKQSANDMAEAAAKERLAKITGDLGKVRGDELRLLQLGEREREKATAALEAEERVRSALRNTAATSDQVEAEVAAARAHAVRAVEMGRTSAAAKSYADAQKAISAASIESQAKLAATSLDGERQSLSQRRELREISAAEEMAQALAVEDRRRGIEMDAAQQKLALMRMTEADNLTGIAAAENEVTELRASHSLDRQRQVDEEVAHRARAVQEMARIEADGAAARGNAGLDVKTENVSFQRAMGKISRSEEIDALRGIANEKFEIEQDLLNKRLQLAGTEETERARINQQILALDERRAADMTRLDHQASLNRLQEIRSITAPFTQATNIMTQGFIQGTLTRQQIASRAAQSIAVSYLNMGTKVATDWLNTHVVMAAWDKLFGAEKAATAAAAEAGKTAATTTGVAARTAATAAGESAQVAAVSAGEAAKVGAKGAGTAAGLGMQAAGDGSSIMMSAWTAMAGAYASISAIPYVGPFLAPVVAAGAFAAVAAMAKSVFSAEGGWGEVPHDGAQTILHKKEMVLPAQFAVPLRAMLTGGGVPGMPAFSAAQIANSNVMPRYGLPSFLGRPIGGDVAAATSPVSNHAGNTTHVHVNATVNGRLSTADIKNFREEVCREFQNGARNGNPHALAALRSGK